jgi:hypothetical protein
MLMISLLLKTFALLALLFAGYGATLLPLLLVWPHVQFQFLLPALIAWAALYLLPLPFFLRLIIRRVWFFKGNGEPVLEDLLRFMLMGINDFTTPVIVSKKRNQLRLAWRCKEPEWCRRMAINGIRKTYELNLEFEASTRTVIMRDRVRWVNFFLCPVRVNTGLLSSARFFWHVKIGKEWGIHNFEHTAADDYTFTPQQLKSPVFNTILANGWNVRFELY